MMLREYLNEQGYTIEEFSKIIDYTPQYMSNNMNGHQRPGRKLRDKVYEATKGAVGRDEWPTERIKFLYEQRKAV